MVTKILVLVRSRVLSGYENTNITFPLSLLIFCQSDIYNSPWPLPASESQSATPLLYMCPSLGFQHPNPFCSLSATLVKSLTLAHMDDVINIIQCEPRRTHIFRSHHSLFCVLFLKGGFPCLDCVSHSDCPLENGRVILEKAAMYSI